MPLMRKLNMATEHRMSVLKNQTSDLLWKGQIETTHARAKEVSRLADKIITVAMSAYEDNIKEKVTVKDAKGKDVTREVVKDGAKKLAARRKIMTLIYDRQEEQKRGEKNREFKARTADVNHPLVEKIFNEYAVKYAERAEEKGVKGGYTRVLKTSTRKGDNTQMAIIAMV